MLLKLIKFNSQMFPFYPNQVALVLGFVMNYLILAKFLAPKTPSPVELVCGGLSFLLMVYLLRICDEIKDSPTDKINFPDRPLIVGVIDEKGLRILMTTVTLLLITLQVPFLGTATVVVFIVIQIYSYLMFKWFFIEDKIRPSLPLALITHNPVAYMFQAYIASFFVVNGTLAWPAVFYLVGEGLTGTAWEISRKIRGKAEEDTYVTYSKIWGPAPPVVVSFILLCLSLGLTLCTLRSVILPDKHSALLLIWSLPAIMIFSMLFYGLKFIFDPVKAPKFTFRTQVETFKLLIFVSAILTYWLL